MVEKHKIVLLGDGGVGKSCITIQVSLFRSYAWPRISVTLKTRPSWSIFL